MKEIPIGLIQSLQSGNCILFLGAGVGYHMIDATGNHAPTGYQLAKELAEHFSIDCGDEYDLSKISQVVEIKKSREELVNFIHKRLTDLNPDETFKWLFTIRWKAIYTTNYDDCILNAYNLLPDPQQTPVVTTLSSNIVDYNPIFNVPVYYLHGKLYGDLKSKIIITRDDYSHFKEQRKMLFEKLKFDFATSNILYIGYSNNDVNWDTVITELSDEFYPTSLPLSYRVAPQTSSLDVEILKNKKNIETIEMDLKEFVSIASVNIDNKKIDYTQLEQLKEKIPTDFLREYEKNPASVLRLFNSWEYVNQITFSDKPNIQSFIKGDKPNWSLVVNKHQMERDIEEQIFEDLLDIATSNNDKPSLDIILGSAGYGSTTLLMSLASKLVLEKAGYIFYHKSGTPLIEGDIEYVTTLFDGVIFFFIDNAADYALELRTIIQHLRERKKSAIFVLSERKNEWRQATYRPRGKEFEIEALSDTEIRKLIRFLEKNSALNKLEFLSDDLRFQAIKNNYKKELLIAMREATEELSFDAIIEDEFRGINNQLAKQLYLIVCCFYQHGAFVREALLAKILDVPFSALYKNIGNSLDGVIIHECIDESKQQYVVRARHRIISTIVWERCGSQSEQENLIQKVLASLNLNYFSDKNAFDSFIKSDRIVEQIKSLEGKIKFFETGCKKDPESEYVRQHYARMLSRENKSDLAFSQIDEAIKLNPLNRILYHTKGIVLTQLAMSVESSDIARRRLFQAEDCFLKAISMYEKDEYSYQSLAHLYLEWAKRIDDQDEIASYIEKAEQTISKGLNVVNEKDSLWVESSYIQKFLGDNPKYLLNLEKAVKDNPNSIIARYLLGRAYRNEGRVDDAIAVLNPVITNHAEEFRASIEYCLALVEKNKSYSEAIAVLRLSSVYGLSDPKYLSILGGFLFLNNEFSAARTVFNETVKRNFNSTELNTIYYKPMCFDNSQYPYTLIGIVVKSFAGYSFIESPGVQQIICPGSKYNGVLMVENLKVSFELAFTAKGPVAINPSVMN